MKFIKFTTTAICAALLSGPSFSAPKGDVLRDCAGGAKSCPGAVGKFLEGENDEITLGLLAADLYDLGETLSGKDQKFIEKALGLILDDGLSGANSDACGGNFSGNSGNFKCVGNAGENPNGQGGWGPGDKGRSNASPS